MKKIFYISLIGIALFTACKNKDWDFPDYDYTTVYFPYQTPIRTLVLGEDIYDNTLDNEHKCKIMATMGGIYENDAERILSVTTDYTMFDSLGIDGDSLGVILPMPTEYYTLDASKKIIIPAGSISGGIEVQLADAFFDDPLSTRNCYVIPLRIESVSNADSILRGESLFPGANIFIPSDWSVVPKDYVLYGVKYINQWNGSYLRRGVDEGKGNNGNTAFDTTIVLHNQYVERDQVVSLSTISMEEASLSLITRHRGSTDDIPFVVNLKFNDAGSCTITSPVDSSYVAVGNGNFIKDGDNWGDKDRDVLHLNYTVDFDTVTHSFVDTLVLRDRNVAMEIFTPIVFE